MTMTRRPIAVYSSIESLIENNDGHVGLIVDRRLAQKMLDRAEELGLRRAYSANPVVDLELYIIHLVRRRHRGEKTNEIRLQCRLNGWKAAGIGSRFATKKSPTCFYADGGPEALDIVQRVLAGAEVLQNFTEYPPPPAPEETDATADFNVPEDNFVTEEVWMGILSCP